MDKIPDRTVSSPQRQGLGPKLSDGCTRPRGATRGFFGSAKRLRKRVLPLKGWMLGGKHSLSFVWEMDTNDLGLENGRCWGPLFFEEKREKKLFLPLCCPAAIFVGFALRNN